MSPSRELLYFASVPYIVHFTDVYIQSRCFPFHVCESNSFVIRYARAYAYTYVLVYAYKLVCHNSARSAFFSIQSSLDAFLRARFYPDGSAENRGNIRSVKRKQEAGIAVGKAAAAGPMKRIKAANRRAKKADIVLAGFSSCVYPIGSFAASPLIQAARRSRIRVRVKFHTIGFPKIKKNEIEKNLNDERIPDITNIEQKRKTNKLTCTHGVHKIKIVNVSLIILRNSKNQKNPID